MKRGEQKRVPAPPSGTQALHLFGGLNACDGTLHATFAAARNSEGFVAWLEHLMVRVYPDPQTSVYLVLDNASFHKSEAALAALSLFETRLQLFWLPTYAPQLNAIERYWQHLKRSACGNVLHASDDALKAALVRQLEIQNDLTHPDRYCLSE